MINKADMVRCIVCFILFWNR